MKPAQYPRCLCCKQPFKADPRNAHHQKYCSNPACQKASKTASQRAWLAAPDNRNYHSGPDAVARVRDWQNAHPAYREGQKIKRAAALQDYCGAQAVELEQKIAAFPDIAEISARPDSSALQDIIAAQPLVFIGLIAHFFNLTLQDDIADTTRSLQQLGEDIANGRAPDDFIKAGDLFRTHAARASAV